MSFNDRSRVEAYILNVEQALEKMELRSSEAKVKELVSLVKDYVEDAKYYLSKDDVFTALACIAYAEGLLDSLIRLGLVKASWKPLSELLGRPKVVVAGTFELLHPGHIELFKYAWEKGRVYVIIARDANAERDKGRKIIVPEEQRLKVVSAIRYVYKAILGDMRDYLKPLEEIKPDIVVLGPDQKVDEKWLEEKLKERGVNARVLRMKSKVNCPLCSTSKIIEKIVEYRCSTSSS